MQTPLNKKSLFHYGWVIWFVAALFYAVEFFQRVAPSVIAKPLADGFHILPATLGLVMSFYYYAYAVSQIPVGILLDRFGARYNLAIACFVVALGTILFSTTDALWVLALARILVGIGSAFAFIGCLKLSRDWFPSRQYAVVVGLTNTLGVVGALAGLEPLTILMNRIGWQQALLVTAMVGIIISLLLVLVVRDRKREPMSCCKTLTISAWQGLKLLVKSWQAWLISIYAGLMVAPIIAFAELWGVAYFEKTQGLSPTLAAQANTLIFIGIAVGGPLNGLFSGWISRRKPVMLIGNLMALLLFMVIILVPHLPLLSLETIMFAFGFFTSSMLVAFPLNAELHPRQISGSVMAVTNMFIMIIGASFQPLIGLVLQVTQHADDLIQATNQDFRHALWILPIALAVNLLILCWIKESHCAHQSR